MSSREVINYGSVKQCIDAEARRVSRENLDGIKTENEKNFLRAWCKKQCEWCDAKFGVENCCFSTDDDLG